MKHSVRKAFLDISKEEAWLNEQGEKGLMLVDYRGGKYEFEAVEPAKFHYKIDIPKFSGDKKKDYFDFLKESGISVVAEYGGRVYLRKNVADGPLELYTDNTEVNQQMSKRYSHLLVISLSQFSLAGYFLLQGILAVEKFSIPFWILLVSAIALIISGIIFLTIAVVKFKKASTQTEKSDKGIRE